MEAKHLINIAGTSCPLETDAVFNKWYDEAHVALMLKFPGISKAVRYRIVEAKEDYPKYLAVYQFESQSAFEKSQEFAEAAAEIRKTGGEKAFYVRLMADYPPIKIWRK